MLTSIVMVVGALLLGTAKAAQHRFTVGALLHVPKANVQAMEQRALEVSDPDSPEWGSYLTNQQVAEMVSIKFEKTQAVGLWLKASLASLKGDAEVKLQAQGDAVTATVEDWLPTYKLGVALMESTAPGTASNRISAPPEGLELLVTPNMPTDFCKQAASDEESCNGMGPCSWNDGNCEGGFNSWYCYVNGTDAHGAKQWTCFSPNMDDDGNDPNGPRYDSRRERLQRERFHARQLVQEATQVKEKTSLGFFVSPRSKAIYLAPPADAGDWKSVEFTYAQMGFFHTKTIARNEFEGSGSGLPGILIGDLTNFRKVTNMSACLNYGDEGRGAVPDKGCLCEDTRSGRDKRLERRCQRLLGSVPEEAPVDFLFPQPPMTASRLRSEAGIQKHGRENSHLQPDGGCGLVFGEFADQSFSENDTDRRRRAEGFLAHGKATERFGELSELPVSSVNSGEGSLDMQIGAALAPEANVGWLAVGPYFMEGFMLAYAVRLNGMDSPPLVHGISWGDVEVQYPPLVVRRLDYELMKTALRGITMVVSSGDNGIRSSYMKCDFVADLGAASPWITAVGATLWNMESKPYCKMPEVVERLNGAACDEPGPVVGSVLEGSIMTSSGYFSIYRERPSYQEAAVQKWLETAECAPCRTGSTKNGPHDLVAPCRFLNESQWCDLKPFVRKNRAVPDIAMPGSAYPTVIAGQWGLSDGTSASSPAWASIVAKLNAEQARRGQPPMGFMNPWLYKMHTSNPDSFVDVTVGSTGSTIKQVCDYGWEAQQGYDPASGLGVPVYDELWESLPRRKDAAAKLTVVEPTDQVTSLPHRPAVITKAATQNQDAETTPLMALATAALAAAVGAGFGALAAFSLVPSSACQPPEPGSARQPLLPA